MGNKQETELLSKTLIEKSRQLITEAENQIRKTDAFYQEMGVEKGFADTFLDSGKATAEEKKKIEADLSQWKQEMERDIKEEQDRFKRESGQSVPASPRMKRGRVMI